MSDGSVSEPESPSASYDEHPPLEDEEVIEDIMSKWRDDIDAHNFVPVARNHVFEIEDEWDLESPNRSVMSSIFAPSDEPDNARKTIDDLRESWKHLVDDDRKTIEEPLAVSIADIEKEFTSRGVKEDALQKTRKRLKNRLKRSLTPPSGAAQLPVEIGKIEEFAVGAYSEKYAYKAVNKALWSDKGDQRFPNFCQILIRALRQLPYVWDQETLWRGGLVGDLEGFEEGDLVCWKGFMSTSRSQNIANLFIAGRDDCCLYRIKSRQGRDISQFSKHGAEKEVLLPPYSLLTIIEKSKDKDGVEIVDLEELYFWKGGRTVLWVADDHQKYKNIIEKAEQAGTNFVLANSTSEAMSFMQFEVHQDLTQAPTDEFRIITNMKRVEKGEEVEKAGMKLIKDLRRLGYKEQVLIHSENADATKELMDIYGAKDTYYEIAKDDNRLYDFATFGIKPWRESKHKKKSRSFFKAFKWKSKG